MAGILVSLATLGLMGYLGSRLVAQSGGRPENIAQLQTRIAVFNMNKAIKQYKKFESYLQENKAFMKDTNEDLMKLKNRGEDLQKKVQQPGMSETDMASMKQELKAIERQFQDKQEALRATMAKKEGSQLTILYKDIEYAATMYARARNIDLVLHYNDALTDVDKYNPMNITRKMETLTPAYFHPQMDITDVLLKMLNDAYNAAPANNGVRPASHTQPSSKR